MMKPKVYVTRMVPQEALSMIEDVAEVKVWHEELPPLPAMLREEVKDIEGLFCLLTDRIDASVMDSAPRLRVISNMAVGYDNIDVAEATRRGIIVGNTPGVLSETTADLAFALLMAAARRIVEADRFTRKGMWKTWGPMVMLGQDIHHSTLGVVGLGGVGAEMARRARGFQMRVLYYDCVRMVDREAELGVEYVPSLRKLLSMSDFVSLHVPLCEETRYLIGARELAAMRPTALLINTSRGTVVDQKALYEALKSGGIRGAAIDVTEVEPVPPDDPLLALENIIITPHIGSASTATRTKMAVMAATNLICGLRGEMPPHCVNPEVLK